MRDGVFFYYHFAQNFVNRFERKVNMQKILTKIFITTEVLAASIVMLGAGADNIIQSGLKGNDISIVKQVEDIAATPVHAVQDVSVVNESKIMAKQSQEEAQTEENQQQEAKQEQPQTPSYTYTDMNEEKYASTELNVRDIPSVDGAVAGTLNTNEKITITGQCNETGWYRINYNNATGYISDKYVTDTPVVSEARAAAARSGSETVAAGESSQSQGGSISNADYSDVIYADGTISTDLCVKAEGKLQYIPSNIMSKFKSGGWKLKITEQNIGILLQFINNNVVASYIAEAVVISVFMVILAGMLLANSHTYMDRMIQKTERKMPDEAAKEYRNIHYITGALLVVLIVLMSCVFSTLDNAVTLVHATGTIDIGQLPRILLAVSGIVAGLLFDIKGRKFMSLIMYCMMMLSTICIAVLKFAGPFVEALAIFYITAGFFVVFFTTSFMEYSRYTGLPDLWAGMGRAVNNITAAVFTGASLTLLSSGEYISIIMLVVIMFVAVSVVTAIYTHFRNTLLETEAAQEETTNLSEEEKLQQIAAKYDFTEREIQAFKLLVVTEESIQNIADNMNVSKRTLERYVSAIYKKTGVKSRVGLINIYNE